MACSVKMSISRHHHRVALGAWLLFSCMTCRVCATTFVIGNNCGYTIWPGVLSNAGVALLANGGFTLQPGQSTNLVAPSGWSGRLWGRTGCNFASDGVGTCDSGDCGGKLECEGMGATPPATLVEFTLQGTAGAAQDYYDVSLVDGYNVPVAVTPSADNGSTTCGVASCSVDINTNCPTSLQVVDDAGQVVSCKSACLAFQSPQYCCDGAYANPTTCTPTNYSEFFKSACPNAYSYAYDDPTSIFTCSSSQYLITFCPSSASSSQKTSNGIVPSNSNGGTTILNSQAWNGSAKNAPTISSLNLLICIIMVLLMWERV